MLALKLLRRHHDKQPANLRYLAWVAIAILVGFLVLRFIDWTHDSTRSLLPLSPGLVVLDDLTALSAIVPLPNETSDAEIYTAGIYRESVGEIPKGTVAVVYIKNDWRFVEIDFLPGMNVQEYLATHIYPTQEIKVDEEITLWIQTIDERPRCIDYEDDVPNRCEISRHLIADLGGRLLLIAADADHATDGEIIQMAKSIISLSIR